VQSFVRQSSMKNQKLPYGKLQSIRRSQESRTMTTSSTPA
jgi:hypothetical protein